MSRKDIRKKIHLRDSPAVREAYYRKFTRPAKEAEDGLALNVNAAEEYEQETFFNALSGTVWTYYPFNREIGVMDIYGTMTMSKIPKRVVNPHKWWKRMTQDRYIWKDEFVFPDVEDIRRMLVGKIVCRTTIGSKVNCPYEYGLGAYPSWPRVLRMLLPQFLDIYKPKMFEHGAVKKKLREKWS